ncbi:MAG: PAS domain S-box protein [Phycisphaerae bacterium]|nr:PAS domain S-box protein [Phycisphaerae bacterium]
MNGRQESEAGSRQNRNGRFEGGDTSLQPDARAAQRQQTEESLRRAEERCALAQRIAGVGTWEWDTGTNEVYWSDETLAIFGLRREGFGGTRKDVAARIHPDDRASWEQSVRECLEQGREHRIEFRVVQPDGSVRWVSVLGDAPRDADGQRRRMLGVALDVTERRRAERALQENESFLEAIFDSIQDGMSVLNLDLTIRRANGVMHQWYARHVPLEGKKCHLCYQDRDKPCEPCPTLRCIQSGRAERDVVPGLSGSPAEWLELFSYPMKDAETGKVTGVVEFVRDITTRKRAEDALRESEQRLRAYFDQSFQYMGLLDPDGSIVAVNRTTLEFANVSEAQLQGRKLWDGPWWTDPEGESPRLQAAVCRAAAGEFVRYETTCTDWQGERHVIDLSLKPFRDSDGSVLRVIAEARDVTEQKQVEQALRRSEANLRVALSAAEMGTWRWDALSNQGTRDAGLSRILGLVPTDSTEPLETAFSRLHPDDRDAARTELERAVRDRTSYSQEFRVVRPDGTVRWLRNQGRPFYDGAGRLLYLTGASVDITARKQAEQERARLEAQLRQAQKLEAVGQLAGGVAHDFNNILTAVLGHVELARAALGPPDSRNETLLDSLREIGRGAERAARLTRQLLAFSRRQIMQPQVLDLNDIVTDMEKMLRRLLSENILFDVVRRPKLHPVRVDPGQIEQVVLNLVVNARDAMPDGGTLTVETRNVLLDEAYANSYAEARPGPHVMLSVSDTGCGMDASVIDRVFEPFFTTKEVGEGTGLGLATVYGIVRQAGGHVTVYSEVERGSTFRVYLPAVADAVSETPAGRMEADVPGGTETIMVCEDDEAVRHLTERLLSSAGYTVVAARNGTHAEEVFNRRQEPIHLLVTDVIMPDMDGRKLADRLMERRPGLKVLFVSGYTSDIIAHHGVLDEGVEFLEKPFSRQCLLQRVRDLLGRDRTRR